MEELVKELLANASVNNAIIFAMCMILADLTSGFIKAFYNKNFKSAIAKQGLWEKAQWCVILIIGYLANYLFAFSPIIYAMCVACVITEFSSILENAHECGIDVPFMEYLQIYEKGEKR